MSKCCHNAKRQFQLPQISQKENSDMTIIVPSSLNNSMKLDLGAFKTKISLRSNNYHDSIGSAEINVYHPISSSSSFPSKTKPGDVPVQKGSVQFQVNAENEIIVEVQTFERYADEELEDVFWSPAARTDFIASARYDCDDVVLDEADLIDDLDEIYGGDIMDEGERIAIEWSASAGRGLESAVLSCVRRSRKKHNKGVLKCQEKHMNKGGGTLESLAKLLRKQSLKSSVKGSKFALLLAAGDRYVASHDESEISEYVCR